MGRFDYLHPKADEVLERLLTESLRRIEADPGFPCKRTVIRWSHRDPDFGEAYREVLQLSAHSAADEARWVREQMLEGKIPADVGRAAQQSCAWEAAVRMPKVYVERHALEHSGSVATQTDEQLNARLTQLLGKAGAGVAARGTGAEDAAEPAG